MKIEHLISTTLLATSALLGLSHASASGQPTYPSTAAIEQARTKFKAELRSLQNSNMADYIRDRRSPAEKQARNNFVNAWQKVDPDVAPFLGQWLGHEISWNIHPSSTKNRVCIMMNIFGAMYVEMGQVVNGNIYTETGGVVFKEGDYLGIAAPLNNNFFDGNSERPFRHPTVPRKTVIDENIEDINKAKRVIQEYKDAGCTAFLPGNSTASNAIPLDNSTSPNPKLIDAIRKQTIHPNPSQVKYSFFEFDLNDDGNKDAIVYEIGSHCGMALCYFHVFLNTGNQYLLLWGQNGLPTYNAKIAILKDSNSKLASIAIPRYSLNPAEYDKVKGWTIYHFDGTEYTKNNVVNSVNSKTIVDFEKAQVFNLSR